MERMKNSILVALGGNALDVKETPTTSLKEEFVVAEKSIESIVKLLDQGFGKIIITHGNGPQVGRIFLQQELTKKEYPRQTTLDVCVADTQGRIGYIIQNAFNNICAAKGLKQRAYSMVTQVVVDQHDPAFQNPTKPIGSFYSKEEADELVKKYGWSMKEQAAGKGMRRVVPSPWPTSIVESELFHHLVEHNFVAVAGGGGGIPVVVDQNGRIGGVEAVIDKDRTSALLANQVGIETFVILTEADHVYLDYGKSTQKALRELSVSQMQKYYDEGHFPAGSMGPKVEAALYFLKGGGKRAIIANLYDLDRALSGQVGTTISA